MEMSPAFTSLVGKVVPLWFLASAEDVNSFNKESRPRMRGPRTLHRSVGLGDEIFNIVDDPRSEDWVITHLSSVDKRPGDERPMAYVRVVETIGARMRMLYALEDAFCDFEWARFGRDAAGMKLELRREPAMSLHWRREDRLGVSLDDWEDATAGAWLKHEEIGLFPKYDQWTARGRVSAKRQQIRVDREQYLADANWGEF